MNGPQFATGESVAIRRLVPIVVLAILGALVFLALSASQSTTPSYACDLYDTCLQQDDDYNGCGFHVDHDVGNYANHDWNAGGCQGGNPNDQASSLKNRGACNIKYFRDAQFDGGWILFNRYINPPDNPTYEDPNLTNGGGAGGDTNANWDNIISSHNFCT
jgi:hypothetical protein